MINYMYGKLSRDENVIFIYQEKHDCKYIKNDKKLYLFIFSITTEESLLNQS